MHRIDTVGAQANQFVDKDPVNGVPGTIVDAAWLNALQEEISYVVEQSSIALEKGTNTQLRQAIQALIKDAHRTVVISDATFAAGVATGNAVRWDAGATRFDVAIADDVNESALGFADVANAAVYVYGPAVIFSGLTPGARYWLSTTVAGGITTASKSGISVGIAKSATELFIDVDLGQADTGPTSIDVIESTNMLDNPAFVHGMTGWGAARSAGNGLVEVRQTGGSDSIDTYFDFIEAQIALNSATAQAIINHLRSAPIDPAKSYRIAGWVRSSAATDTLRIDLLNRGFGGEKVVGITQDLAVGTANAEFTLTINATGGAAPAWPANAYSAMPSFINQSGAVSSMYLKGLNMIRADRLPFSAGVPAEPSRGTHEAVSDGTYIYMVAHSHARVAKFDLALNRVADVACDAYPHDITLAAGNLWVVTYNGKSIQKIDPVTMTVTATYAITGARQGFGIGYDGANIWVAAGEPATTPALIKVDPATGTQTVMATGINGGTANMPVVILADSIWSIDSETGAISDVKRFAPNGTLQATISAGIGKIYGGGTDGVYMYVGGALGVAQIDPATNSVTATYLFERHQARYCGTNLKHENGRMWGCTQNGASVFYVDVASGRIVQSALHGVPKWVCPVAGEVVVGNYVTPDLYRVAAA